MHIFLIFIVIQLQLCAFAPHPSTPPQLNPPPSPTSTLPLDFVHVSFIVVPVIPCFNKVCIYSTFICSMHYNNISKACLKLDSLETDSEVKSCIQKFE